VPGVKVLRIVLVAVAVLVVVAVASTQYLFAREAVPEESSYVLDRAALADAARSLDGPLPLRVNHHVVALASLPRGAVFAGESMDPHRMVHGVYQVVYDHGHVLIDAGFSRDYFEAALASEGSQYDDAAFERVARALEAAQVMVLTHEHADHIEGLGEAAAPERLARHVVMNATQHASEGAREVLPEAFLAAVESAGPSRSSRCGPADAEQTAAPFALRLRAAP